MTDPSKPNNDGQQNPTSGDGSADAGQQYPVGHLSPAPVEQPYFVPTPHEQAWSSAQQSWSPAQQYPFYPPVGPGQAGPYAGQSGQYPGPYQPGQYQPGQYPGAAAPYWTGAQFWTPPPVQPPKKKHKVLYGSMAAAVVTALAVGGIAFAVDNSHNGSSQQTALTTPNTNTNPFSGSTGGFGGVDPNAGSGSSDGTGSGSTGSGSTGSNSTNTTGTATAAQSVGVVDINTTLDYGTGKAAGTGLVLTADGTILTNNHVVADSTAISVTVVSTGKTYTATVVGTDPTDDISVIKLANASGLATAKLDTTTTVAAGTKVVGVGNAGGTGGTPSSATGTVTAVNQSITASDEDGSSSEKLTGMIETDADIQAGDSGGPLYSVASGGIIGIDTAASTSSSGAGRFGASSTTTTDTTGFAIPISKALSIASQITSGTSNTTIHQGLPAFLGVQFSSETTGADIAGVVSGSAAAKAGLAAGDTVTAVDGKAVATSTALATILATHKPGDQVKISYTNTAGSAKSLTVTLGSGPAD